MKKTMLLICILLIIGLVFIFAGCKKEAEPAPAVEEEAEEVPPALPAIPEQEQEIITQEHVVITEPVREEAPTELLSDLRCIDSKIEGTVTNVLDEQIDLSEAIVYINGMLRRNPECDTLILEPGESTFCTNLKGVAGLKDKGNKLIFRISGIQAVEIIDCE